MVRFPSIWLSWKKKLSENVTFHWGICSSWSDGNVATEAACTVKILFLQCLYIKVYRVYSSNGFLTYILESEFWSNADMKENQALVSCKYLMMNNYQIVMGRTPFYQTNWNIIFRTSNELEREHLNFLFLSNGHGTSNLKGLH